MILPWLLPILAQQDAPPPGVIVDHLSARLHRYVGSPSLAILPSGDYIATHDEFGPKSGQKRAGITFVFRSFDRGKSWQPLSSIQGAFWSTLFVNQDRLYLLGTDREYGNLVIRRSDDGGATWTQPKDESSGLLRNDFEYHCAPVPVLAYRGRLWRGVECRNPPHGWGTSSQAAVMSAPIGADLLNAASWTLTNFLPSDRAWNGGDMGGWLEGNAVVAPDGEVVDVLRVDTQSMREKAAVARVGSDTKSLRFDDAKGFVDFPGGAKKFTIRFDPESHFYWSLVSMAPSDGKASKAASYRNTLALTRSSDLLHWQVRAIVLHHPNPKRYGFQYVDWQFDGDDLVAVCRTASKDARGGAHSAHDANYLTFHRIANFRDLRSAPGE
jgi:hypothetical protein